MSSGLLTEGVEKDLLPAQSNPGSEYDRRTADWDERGEGTMSYFTPENFDQVVREQSDPARYDDEILALVDGIAEDTGTTREMVLRRIAKEQVAEFWEAVEYDEDVLEEVICRYIEWEIRRRLIEIADDGEKEL
jgi:hypothetical protein